MVYGCKPPTITYFISREIKVKSVARELIDCDEALKQLKDHLFCAQQYMK